MSPRRNRRARRRSSVPVDTNPAPRTLTTSEMAARLVERGLASPAIVESTSSVRDAS